MIKSCAICACANRVGRRQHVERGVPGSPHMLTACGCPVRIAELDLGARWHALACALEAVSKLLDMSEEGFFEKGLSSRQ